MIQATKMQETGNNQIQNKSLSIRIDEEMLNKLHVVADYEGRSANSEILILIRDAIAAYEKQNGKIEL